MGESTNTCCFCLNNSEVTLTDLFTKINENSSFFEKISISLFRIANFLTENSGYKYKICSKCCETTEMIYQFNMNCLNNLNIFLSYKNVDKIENENFSLKNELDSNFEANPIDDFAVKQENISPDSDQIIVKKRTNKGKIQKKKRQKKIKKEKNPELAPIEDSTDIFSNDITFGNDGTIVQGAKKITKEFNCEVCGKIFFKKSNLNLHLRIHTKLKPYICEICAVSFNQKSGMNRHMLIHTGEKPHKCKTCTKAFSDKSALNRHIKIHTGDRPYLCDRCDMRFKQSSALTNHQLVHTGIKPHKCDACGKCFARKSHLIRHKLAHTGERPYACKICVETFIRQEYLSQHKRMYNHY